MPANPWIAGASPSDVPEDRPEAAPDPPNEGASDDPQTPISYAERFLAARPRSAAAPPPPKASTQETEPRRSESSREAETAAEALTEPVPPASEAGPKPAPAAENKGNRELLRTLIRQRASTKGSHLGKFSRKRERQAVANLRELSMVEGNLMGMGSSMRTLYFTSCFAGEGKTTALLETAYALAVHQSRTTILVDGNSNNPRLHDEFGIANRKGLREVLQGTASLPEAIRPTAYESLYLLPSGSAKSPLQQAEFGDMLTVLAANFDYVLVDGTPLLSSSEVSTVAPYMNGFILVVECEKTKWEVVQLAQEKLGTAGANHTGIVLNRRRFYVPKPVYRLMSKR